MSFNVTESDILAAIRTNRRARVFWQTRGMDNIAQSHTDNIRDLRIMLLSVRFPNNTFGFTYGEGFSPFIVVRPDDNNDNNNNNNDTSDDNNNGNDNDNDNNGLSADDMDALTGAIIDHVQESTGELINA